MIYMKNNGKEITLKSMVAIDFREKKQVILFTAHSFIHTVSAIAHIRGEVNRSPITKYRSLSGKRDINRIRNSSLRFSRAVSYVNKRIYFTYQLRLSVFFFLYRESPDVQLLVPHLFSGERFAFINLTVFILFSHRASRYTIASKKLAPSNIFLCDWAEAINITFGDSRRAYLESTAFLHVASGAAAAPRTI